MVFDHDDDGALVDGEVGFGLPVGGFAEAVDKSVFAPDFIAEVFVEMAERLHRLFRRVGQG